MSNENLSENIIRLRKINKLSQSGLAKKLHVSVSAVSKWENEKNLPDVHTLKAMAEIFHVPIEEILAGNCENCDPIPEEPEEIVIEIPELEVAPEVIKPEVVPEVVPEVIQPEIALANEAEKIETAEILKSVESSETVEVNEPTEAIGRKNKSFAKKKVFILVFALVALLSVIGHAAYEYYQSTLPYRIIDSRSIEDPVWGAVTEITVVYNEELSNPLMDDVMAKLENDWLERNRYGGKFVNALKIFFYSDKKLAQEFSSQADSYIFLFPDK